jgi:hypothetical protein
MSTEDFIISVYCLVEDIYQKVIIKRLRSKGPMPKLSDSEVITMEIVGEFLGLNHDKQIWKYFSTHWLEWFPNIGSRKTFVTQASNLSIIKNIMRNNLAKQLGAFSDDIHLFDGFPMPVCHYKRSSKTKLFKSEADYGYCAAKDEKYYGFKGHLLVSMTGIPTTYTFASAEIDQRKLLPELVSDIKGLVIADKGLIDFELQGNLIAQGINLQTPLRSNMKDDRDKCFVKMLVSTRRLVETVIGQLTDRFGIANLKARKLWHFSRKVARKILAHTVAYAINLKINPLNPLQFDKIIN